MQSNTPVSHDVYLMSISGCLRGTYDLTISMHVHAHVHVHAYSKILNSPKST